MTRGIAPRWVGIAAAFAALGGLIWSGQAAGEEVAAWPSGGAPMTFNGDASVAGQYIRLTNQALNQTGTAFTQAKVVNHRKSFKSEFSFWLNNASSPAEGIAFVIHPKADTTVGDTGSGIGYGSIGKSVAVEFDTTDNGGSEEAANEVAIVVNGQVSKPRGSGVPAFPLHDADRFAWVSYSARTHKVKAYISESSDKPSSPIATAKVNLEKVLGGKARAGFTAATSSETASQFLMTWSLDQ